MRAVLIKVLDRLGVKAQTKRLLEGAGVVTWTWTPLVPERAFIGCCRNAIGVLREHNRDADLGDYLEFGVSRGTSLSCVHKVLVEMGLPQMRLIGFDSFEGLPPEAAEEGWRPGQYKSTLAHTRAYLTKKGVDWQRVTLVPGWFSETLTEATKQQLGLAKASLVMIDCDTYSASRAALFFCASLLHDQAVIIFDDWGWRADVGEIGQKEAFDEFLAAFPNFRATPLPTYHPAARVFVLVTEE